LLKIADGVSRFEKFTTWLSAWFEHIAIFGFLGMMLATLIDVVGAKAFNWPLPVGTEAVYLPQLIAVAGAMAYGQIEGRHIRVELVLDRFPRKVRALFHGLAALLGLALFAILAWKSYQYGMTLREANEVTVVSRMPLFPFAFFLGLCCIPMCLVLIVDLIKAIREGLRK
jgi:TRAP-type C4-dicarboxylate transport system permease small subunit